MTASDEKFKIYNSKSSMFNRFTAKLYTPVDPSSLGVVRALFGLMMMMDVPHERGLHALEQRFGDNMNCHFPLVNYLQPLPFEYMGLVYLIMWIGSLGICVGYKFRMSCALFAIPYWYVFLLDKSSWNNHSYLYGLVALLFLCSSAHHYLSVDCYIDQKIRNLAAPVWNYWIIRFQLFVMYFYAGIKKMDPDWLSGNSLSLSAHWVFDPFRVFLTSDQIDLWVIHRFGFLFDLTVGFFLICDKSRPFAILFSSLFHLMNSRIFNIGQFPYVCLVTTPIFCSYRWPKKLFVMEEFKTNSVEFSDERKKTIKKGLTTCLLGSYVLVQLFLPFSHSITKGYNNWTNGLYGYSWDMMIHSWNTKLISIAVEDHDTGNIHFIDPEAWVVNTRYSKHADMIIQYAACLKRNLAAMTSDYPSQMRNISIYMDVWCSLNKRFLQRFIDPRQDLLTAQWHPFSDTAWVVPVLSKLALSRTQQFLLNAHVWSWNNFSDVLFAVDLPGLIFDHYLEPKLNNVTLVLLSGAVTVYTRNNTQHLLIGSSVSIPSGEFHTISTTSRQPSAFMYTFTNGSTRSTGHCIDERPYDIFSGWVDRMRNFLNSFSILRKCIIKLIDTFVFPFSHK